MNVNPTAPVITRDEILIDAPLDVVWKTQTDIAAWPRWRPQVPAARFEGNLAVGSVFHWEEGGLQIASTVQEIDPPRRLVWDGPAQGIYAIHVWEFTPTNHGVFVHTEESWEGEPVRAQAATLQPLLDAAIRTWLTNLKRAAEGARVPMILRLRHDLRALFGARRRAPPGPGDMPDDPPFGARLERRGLPLVSLQIGSKVG